MEVLSPKLKTLKERLLNNEESALTDFWYEIETNGTPLIEPALKENYKYVTFFYKELEPLNNVVVVLGPARIDFFRNQMSKLLDTDIWYRTYELKDNAKFQYLLSPNDSLLYPIDVLPDYKKWAKRESNFQIDPLNKSPYPVNSPVVSTLAINGDNFLHIDTTSNLDSFTIQSNVLNNQRKIWIYTPTNYSKEIEYPVLVLLDGELNPDFLPATAIINRLINELIIDPMIIVFVGNAEGQREKDFGCDESFSQFLSTELIDFVQARYSISSIDNTICGFSMGGVCAAYTALCHPDTYHNVISASGSFFWGHSINGESGKPIREFIERRSEHINIYLECGLMEDHNEFQKLSGGTSTLQANRHFRDVLISKGYNVSYQEYNGGHDWINWADTLHRGLLHFHGQDAPTV